MLWCYAKTDEDDNLEVGEDVCESGAAMTVVDMLIIAVMFSGMIALVVVDLCFSICYLGWSWRKQWHPTPVFLPGKSHGQRSLVGCSPGVAKSRTRLSDFTFHFHPWRREGMALHSSILAWKIPWIKEPGGLQSRGRKELDMIVAT